MENKTKHNIKKTMTYLVILIFKNLFVIKAIVNKIGITPK